MALSKDNSTSGNNINNPLTLSFTIASSANLLIVCENTYGGSFGVTPTWKGVALTKAISDFSGTIGVSVWYMVSPSTGTGNIVVPFPNVGPINTSANFVEVISIIGASLSTPIGATTSNLGGGASISNSLSTTTANSWVLDSTANTGNFAPTKGGSQTLIASQSNTGNGGGGGGASFRPTTTTGSYAMAWSGGVGGTIWDTALVEIIPASTSTNIGGAMLLEFLD